MILKVEGINKAFGQSQILCNANLTIETPQIVGLTGQNGCGKSVLLKVIAGLLRADSGTVTICDKIVGFGIYPKEVGLLIERPGLIQHLSGYRNLQLITSINKLISKSEIIQWMEHFGLDPLDTKPVKAYSLGMKQKLGIIMAMIERPKLLLLDEPMSNLDDDSILYLHNMLAHIKELKDTAVIIASHQITDIAPLCDRVLRIEKGTLEER